MTCALPMNIVEGTALSQGLRYWPRHAVIDSAIRFHSKSQLQLVEKPTAAGGQFITSALVEN